MTRDNYIFLGTIVKIRGIYGELVVRTKRKAFEIKDTLQTVMLDIDGLLVPFFISSWNTAGNNEIIISLEDIESREKAEKLKDRNLFIPAKDILNHTCDFFPASLDGYLVTDKKSGDIGIVKGVLEIPENTLLRVKQGKREILIPFQRELILAIDEKNKLIRVDLPEGLLEL